jgi:hypothetical protein
MRFVFWHHMHSCTAVDANKVIRDQSGPVWNWSGASSVYAYVSVLEC